MQCLCAGLQSGDGLLECRLEPLLFGGPSVATSSQTVLATRSLAEFGERCDSKLDYESSNATAVLAAIQSAAFARKRLKVEIEL